MGIRTKLLELADQLALPSLRLDTEFKSTLSPIGACLSAAVFCCLLAYTVVLVVTGLAAPDLQFTTTVDAASQANSVLLSLSPALVSTNPGEVLAAQYAPAPFDATTPCVAGAAGWPGGGPWATGARGGRAVNASGSWSVPLCPLHDGKLMGGPSSRTSGYGALVRLRSVCAGDVFPYGLRLSELLGGAAVLGSLRPAVTSPAQLPAASLNITAGMSDALVCTGTAKSFLQQPVAGLFDPYTTQAAPLPEESVLGYDTRLAAVVTLTLRLTNTTYTNGSFELSLALAAVDSGDDLNLALGSLSPPDPPPPAAPGPDDSFACVAGR